MTVGRIDGVTGRSRAGACVSAGALHPDDAARFGLDNQRRALRLHVVDLVSEWLDEGSLRLSFALPSGAFATSVLRELVQLRESADAIPVE